MYETYKVVVVIPSGRKKSMELLIPRLLEQSFIDEIRLWVNTTNSEDLEYIRSLKHPIITLDEREHLPERGSAYAIHKFFDRCIDENTIYIRMDDDVIWMQDDFIEQLVYYRVEHPEFFLVHANTINNAICDHVHQKTGALPFDYIMEYDCMGNYVWSQPHVAEWKHRIFLNQRLESHKYRGFVNWILRDYERCSINCISWFGSEFKKFNGEVGIDEEQWLSVDKPMSIGKRNAIFGNALCVHYAFYTQRQHLDKTNILEEYKKLL